MHKLFRIAGIGMIGDKRIILVHEKVGPPRILKTCCKIASQPRLPGSSMMWAAQSRRRAS